MEATREAAAIGVSINDFNADRPFTFDDYPLTRQRVESLMLRFKAAVEVCVVNGVESEWTLANNKNNELANRVFGHNVGQLTQEQYRRYYSTNEAARDAFLQRKEQGLSLSDRVWRYTGEFKEEIEMGLDLGLRGGLSADQMTHDLRQYLQHPDMLFRRVRDEHGMLHLSKRAAAFHPGRGVYRSSYMNARRLAATEGNIAYRTSDHMRWQEMDFVVGIEIHLSNNHTCKGRDGKPHPFHDICDELQGRYPKDFKFTGWHPHCRCYATSILKTDEEIARDTQRILNGEPVDGESVNRVQDVPDAFKQWVSDNSDRIGRARVLPYFLRDNDGYMNAALEGANAPMQPVNSLTEIKNVFNRVRLRDPINGERQFAEGIAGKFDFLGVREEINRTASRFGININSWKTTIHGEDMFSITGEDEEYREFHITRTFFNKSDGLEVHHDLFEIAKRYQGNGLSKQVFQTFYQQYKKLGVRYITVDANIDIGGYTWARYGFKAKNRAEAMSVAKRMQVSSENSELATNFIKDWYKKNSLSPDEPFPMRLLSEQPWGKEVLLGSYWEGIIDLSDPASRKIFETYLGL